MKNFFANLRPALKIIIIAVATVAVITSATLLIVLNQKESYSITYNNTQNAQNDNPLTYKEGKGENKGDFITLKGLPDSEWYTFNGWYSDEAHTANVQVINTKKDGNVTLYADWKLKDFTATYKINGETVHVQSFNAESASWQSPEITVEQKGYEITWENFTVKAENFTVNAVYTPINYTLTYTGVTGVENDNPQSYTVESENITLLNPTSEHYDFAGWFVDNKRIETIYTSEATSLTVEARWTPKNYTVTYQNLMGVDASQFTTTYTVESPSIILPNLSVDYYTFNGWLDQNGKPITSIQQGSFGDLILTASFTPIEYSITYYNTMGADVSSLPTTYNVETSGLYINDVSVEHYEFFGWYDENGERVRNITPGKHGDLHLTAKLTPITYYVTYSLGANVNVSENDNIKSYTVEKPDYTLKDVSRDYYNFLGWFDATGNQVYTIQTSKGGNITLYAKWEAISYTITYTDCKNADISDLPTAYTYEKTLKLPDISTPYYRFLGWFNEEDKQQSYVGSTNLKNLVLKAKWEAIEYTIYYEDTKNIEVDTSALPATYTVESEDIIMPEASKKGYTFEGWFDQDDNEIDKISKGSGGNLILTPRFTAIKYTITYLNAEGFDLSNHPTTYTVEKSLVIRSLSRDYYEFLGWFDQSDLPIENTNERYGDLILYPKWNAITYTISYVYDETIDTSSYIEEYTAETAVTKLPVPEKEHYEFYSWEDVDTKRVYTDLPVDSPTNLVLKAIFTLKRYVITYTNLKQANIESLPSEFTVENSDITLANVTTDYYEFLGWVDQNGNAVEYINAKEGGNRVLQAQWKPIEYNVTYQGLKGANDSEFVKNYNVESDNLTLPVISVDYYNFNGWLTQGGDLISVIEKGSHQDITLTASFTPISYGIVYGNLLDAEANDLVYTYNVESNFALSKPQRKGYTFTGWENEKGETVWEIKEGLHGEINLTATWDLTTYTINYLNVHGADLSDLETQFTILSEDIYLSDISQKGYTFNGWTDKLGNKITVIKSGTSEQLDIYANWIANEYTVTLNTVYGELATDKFTVYYNEDYTLPVPLSEGKIFMGWYSNTGESGERYTDEQGKSISGYPVYVNRTLFARWKIIEYTVTYNSNGGSEIESQTVSHGDNFDDSAIPIKTGAMFAGWYSEDYSTKFTNGTIIKQNVTVYAKWIESIAISTAEEFWAISSNTAANYYLVKNISLNGAIWSNFANFTGTLDGKGYCVEDFLINSSSASGNFGFFANNSGTIQNLTLKNFTFNATERSGATLGVLVGNNSGKIYNCSIQNGVIQMTSSIIESWKTTTFGGMVGYNSGIVVGCTNSVSIIINTTSQFTSGAMWDEVYDSFHRFGGLVGYNAGTVSQSSFVNATISVNSFCYGLRERIVHVYSYTGGLIGQNAGVCFENYVNATAEITMRNQNTSETASWIFLGGLVGYNAEGTVSYCYSTGSVTSGSATYATTGGLIGINSAYVNNCYSSANVTANLKGSSAGAFVGTNDNSIQNCYSTGAVSSSAVTIIGGFAGDNSSTGSIQKCFSSSAITTPSGSTCGHFVGSTNGVIFKCYYNEESILNVGGAIQEIGVEHGNVYPLKYSELWSENFLINQLYWDNLSWVFVSDEPPALEWETAINHDYQTTVIEPECNDFGYTIYHCSDCNRFYVKDVVESPGHEFAEIETVNPTCTLNGQVASYCVRCDQWISTEILPATGHVIGELIESEDATCTEAGYAIHFCPACKQNVTYLLNATGHTPARIAPVMQTCTEIGYTEEIYCSVCLEVLEEKQPVEPHFFSITNLIAEPTCVASGLCDRICSICFNVETSAIIPEKGHSDVNGDYLCDECGILFGKYNEIAVIEIDTVEKLDSIRNNLYGIYRLTADITLTDDWKPIGDQERPFAGYFDGNGHTISYANQGDSAIIGIFGYNTGIISGVTVKYLNLITQVNLANTQNQTVTTVIGGLVAYNKGLVSNCVAGTSLIVNVLIDWESDEYKTGTVVQSVILGGLVGINLPGGQISGCENNAQNMVNMHNNVICNADWALSALLGNLGPSKHKNTKMESFSTITFGAIVGENQGDCKNCLTSGKLLVTGKLPSAKVDNNYGYAIAHTTYYHGVIAGVNSGTLTDCSSTCTEDFAITNNKTVTTQDTGLFYGEYTYFYVYKQGLTGKEN